MYFTPLLFLRSVTGMSPVIDSARDSPNDVVHPPLSTSVVASLPASTTSDSYTFPSFLDTSASQSDRIPALVVSVTPQLVHRQTIPHANPLSRAGIQPMSTEVLPTAPLSTHQSPSSSFNTKSLPSQPQHVPASLPQSTTVDSTDTAFAQPCTSSSLVATTSSSSAPKIRFALIGVLAGVPALTILGFVISFRWRRTRQARGRGMKRIHSNCVDLLSNIKGRKSARFSSFFGINNIVVVPEKAKVGRNHLRPMYASSIHSTAGLAGVGAHRGASMNSGAPPMIHYVNAGDIGLGADMETKANFDNPFGTPPPVRVGFITAPSRVSPHLTQTPLPQLINLPRPTATHRDVQVAQLGRTGVAISHPMTISTQSSSSRHHAHSQDQGQNEHCWQEVKDQLPTHVSPEMANRIRPRTWHYRRPRLQDLQRSPVPDGRMSVATSVYGGLSSPRALACKKQPPDINPVIPPHLFQSPRSEQTPVLPYLSSPATRSESPKERRQARGVGPVIVIEGASPTIESESEYADTDVGEEAGGPFRPEGSEHTRRTGLIGSPHGFVPPSSTFSSVSSYSISGNRPATSSSISTVIPHDSSASSALVLSASSSDDSSVTVRAAVVNSAQATVMRSQDSRGGKQTNLPAASRSQPQRDVNRLDREGLRGIAF